MFGSPARAIGNRPPWSTGRAKVPDPSVKRTCRCVHEYDLADIRSMLRGLRFLLRIAVVHLFIGALLGLCQRIRTS